MSKAIETNTQPHAHTPTEATAIPASGAPSEYLAARADWDDRFAGQRKTVRVLTGITLLALTLGGLGMGYGIYTGARTQYIPYIIQVDELARIATTPPPERVGTWPAAIVRRELDLFFDRLRSVSPDLNVIATNHGAVEHFLPGDAPATTKLRAYFRQPGNNPISRAEDETVAVDVISVNQVTDGSWRVEWRETLFDRRSGRETGMRRFVATVQVVFRPPTSQAILHINPLGLFIQDLDIQEIAG
ncbi:VirB8/TrbF family protein [Ruegeria sp.]|uniref:VirB8/TrbF family protein n=1 Tax=Ruegeria sp. TaxID=1879320 RepID=UPI003B000B0F